MGNALSCYEDTAPENSPEEKDPLPRGGGGMLLSCCNGGLLWNQIGDDDGDESSDRVFIPDADRSEFVVVGVAGATIRAEQRLNSRLLKTVPHGTIVLVSEVRSRRAHIVQPVDGWVSLTSKEGYVIVEALDRDPSEYTVVADDGTVVHSSSSVDEGRIVRIAPFGEILKATGKTEIIDAVEKVQIEDGWVSMTVPGKGDVDEVQIEPVD